MSPDSIAVLGGGSFGTVIANIIAENGYPVNFWMRDSDRAAEVNRTRENSRYLPGYRLHDNVCATSDIEQAVEAAGLIFVVVPSAYFRSVVSAMKDFRRPDSILISTAKGIEAGSFLLMSEVLQQEVPAAPIGILSGPNLAHEVAERQLTGSVVASDDASVIDTVQTVLRSEYFRVYSNKDMFGVELGGSLKNIYAIIAGLAAARGMAHNTNAMLVTRSLTEMARFGRHLGADPMTFLGLSGVGDLIVTCSSSLSRNYRVGYALGQGKSLTQAVEELGQVAEGVNTLRLVKEKADALDVYMPLASGLYAIMFEGRSVDSVASSLMLGERALDVEYAADGGRGAISSAAR